MLSNNLSAILTYFKSNVPFLIEQKVGGFIETNTPERNAWLENSGTLDLMALTYKDENLTTSDLLPDTSHAGMNLATNRGQPCLLDMEVQMEIAPCPKLDGYIVPKLGKFRGVVCQIHRVEDEQTVLEHPFFSNALLTDHKVELLDNIFQRLYDLPHILGMKGIFLESVDNIRVNLQNGDIIVDPRHLSDIVQISRGDIDSKCREIEDHLNRLRPKDYVLKLKPHPEMKRSLCFYDVPDLSKVTPVQSKQRIINILDLFSFPDLLMCLLSMGKINELDLIGKYSTSRLIRDGGSLNQGDNNAIADTRLVAINYLSKQLPYIRANIDGVLREDNLYTYQAEYTKERYKLAGTEERTELIYPDELEFKYFLDDVEYITGTRNKLAKAKGTTYYDPIYGSKIDDSLIARLSFMQRNKVVVNGIEFKKEELRPFYGSLFYDIVAYSSKDEDKLDIPYLSIKDLGLIKDFVKGMLMLEALYYQLSDKGYEYLSGQGTLLEFSEIRIVRNVFNNIFSFGEALMSNLDLVPHTLGSWFPSSLLMTGLGLA